MLDASIIEPSMIETSTTGRQDDGAARRPVALALLAASGFAGLGYQIVWTRQGALWLGHESAALLAVLAAFFGGLALGAWTTGPRIARSAQAGRWYAACELVVALWGLVLLAGLPSWGGWLVARIGVDASPMRQWGFAFAGTFVALLPSTMAMGATLPAIERVSAGLGGGRSIAACYASNTAGAVVGVLACAFWLVPTIGLARTTLACVALNLACAATALAVLRPDRQADRPASAPSDDDRAIRVAALARLFVTGLLGIGYEVLVGRVLGQLTEETVYTFATLLAVYLVGTALGAAVAARRRVDRADDATGRWTAWLALAVLVGTASLYAGEMIRTTLGAWLGPSVAAALAVEAALALVSFLLPTIAMGGLFAALSARAVAHGADFGRALAIDTAGAAFAPAMFGLVVAPALGPKAGLLLVAFGYVALAGRAAWTHPLAWTAVGLALAMAAFAPPLAFVDVPDGGRVVRYVEGAMAAVSVVEDADGVLRLRIDDREQEGTSATRRVDSRQALLPMLLHPAPKRALFLGLGTGTTASAAAAEDGVDVTAVELLPEVVEASQAFAVPADRAPRIVVADARRYVRTATDRDDVIVSDNFHPARSGSGSLYTVEHFRAIRDRLAPGGLFCQWLPLHQLDLGTLRSIVRSFVEVYPEAWAVLANNGLDTPVIGLVARPDVPRFDVAAIRQRLAQAALPAPPSSFGLDDDLAVLGSVVAGPAALRRFAGDAPLNTDDRPVVAYAAPRIAYAPTTSPRDRLATLLATWTVAPDEIVDASAGPAYDARLAAYRTARDRFIAAGRDVRPTRDAASMLRQVEAPLLAILATSPDFRPAYDPLLRLAAALAPDDPAAARALLTQLLRLQPSRPEAGRVLARLDESGR